MRIYETKSALKVFYYLLAVDGTIDENERMHFHSIGMSLDPGHFGEYEKNIENECKIALINADDDEYEIILESVDEALTHEAPPDDQGLTPRLMIWNLFVAAFSNGIYDDYEKRLINHIARKADVDKSVVLEMEQMVNTLSSIQKEIDWAKLSGRSADEIGSIIIELEKRQEVITKAAEYLIADEIDPDNPYEYKPDFFDKTKEQIDKRVKPVTGKIGQTVMPVALRVGSAVAPVASKAKDKTGEVFGKLSSRIKKDKNNEKEGM